MKRHNIKSKEQLLQELAAEQEPRVTCSFYRYVALDDLQTLRDSLYDEWVALGVLGRIYIAHEGINAQFSVPASNLDAFLDKLNQRDAFANMPIKYAVEEGDSFIKLAIKIREEIVAYKVPESEYDMDKTGNHLDYQAFNAAIENGATVIDLRNQYEGEVGKFENAIVPDVERSQELLEEVKTLLAGKEDEKVLMYCTGGIRCEKASSYLIHHGFKDVNQLHGGIIQYANDVKENGVESKFIGKNFVFDRRMGERITDDIISTCHQCRKPADTHTNCANPACHILFIQCADCAETYDNCCTQKCADFIKLPIEEQRKQRRDGDIQFTAQLSEHIKPKLYDLVAEELTP